MPVEKQCTVCNKSLAGYRSHAEVCGSTCRGIKFRANKEVVVPMKLAFSAKNFEAIKTAAESAGISITQYAHDRVMFNEGSL